ncbi:conserved oligomeric Golgi complex subunit 7 [Asbolus verrucosus]|uniref:Conserved oligomeric Golgi complex subunit 7 n=1 Tax=Asbolus verrucosus TaxID=1661398 RepID=A0A482VQE6_ASBVE|nr:conserved oligomeric Golgi complex subunit 7 [Asbolus verrucosus]
MARSPMPTNYLIESLFTGYAGWLYYQIKTTQSILSNALDTSILSIMEPSVTEKPENDDFFIIDITKYREAQNFSWENTWNSFKFMFAKRLLILANNENRFIRKKAVRQLARMKILDYWHFSLLSNMIDARTAVGLARTANADPRLFIEAPLRYLNHTQDMIVDVMKDLLVNLHATSQHPCMGYFISKAFAEFHEVVPMCLESLLHHASVKNYAKDIAELNGLPLLMEIHNRFKDNINVTATICRIISYLSMHRDLLDELHKSGWIGILAQWVKHDDVRISIPAAKALANLDLDEDPIYLQRLYPLHPSTRTLRKPGADIVFVHGLLGGVFFTWRQRKRHQDPLGFLGKRGEPDYDVVWEDIPTNTNQEASGPYCCPGSKYTFLDKDEECPYTNCWPKDWLAEDCDHLRIIGVNYETNLSLWTPICPVEKVKTLDERSDELMYQLIKAGLGKRPIVWVTHSMGGLMVKNLLSKAYESNDKEIRDMSLNTRGIIFYSTPHVGSSVAKFSQAAALVICPTTEVQELQENSPKLIEIHQKFVELVKKIPMKVVTFVETKPTVVSAMKFKFLIVQPHSGNPGIGEYYEIPLDHLGICKPASSAFSDDNFDTKAWINGILKNAENQDKKENYTMSVVMKLQLCVQQVNSALEETSQQVLMSLPKIIRDTKNLHQEAAVLKEKMAAVRDEIVKIERDTGKSINTIEKLDTIKNELHLAKQGLHESDNWSVLVNDLEEVFDSKNIENISTKIIGMQRSLQLLVNVGDYEDRRLQLEGLKNRLEAIASPAIVQAFTSCNTEQSAMFVRIFKSMGRLPQLLKYYHKCQKDVLLKKWRNQLEIEQDESVMQWIHNFYGILLSNWHTQQKWFNQVFTNQSSSESFIEIYTDVLNSLDPTLNECIDAALKQTEDKLNFLFEVKLITQQFANNLTDIIEQTSQGKASKEKLLLLLQAIFNHLVAYTNKYAAYEQAHLIKKLSTINCMKEELPDTIQALGLSIPQVIDIARDAKRRCQQITENCGYCGLIIALRAFLLSYADQYRVALRQIDRSKKHEEDWNNFQLCLSLLQNTGEVLLKLHQLEKDLTATILEINQNKDQFEYKYLLLNSGDRKEYESLVRCVTEGTQLSLLDHVNSEFNKLCSDIHHTTYQVVFAPISVQLDVVQAPRTWTQFANSTLHNSDLPDYSFSPQEYITQIGQYLMTLPQHLEPFLFRDNPSLTCALKAVDQEYNTAGDVEGALAHVFLKVVARGTCQGFCDRILSICELSHPASRQLAHDIGYLNNVLQDLGISLSENLQQLALLLKLPTDQYHSGSTGCSARYVAAVRQMRNITSN